MKNIPNLFLKGYATVRETDGFQFGHVADTTNKVKRRFTDNFKSHYNRFDDQTDYIMVQPVNPVALKNFLNDVKKSGIDSDELIKLLMDQLK